MSDSSLSLTHTLRHRMKTLGSYFCVSCLGSLSHTHRCSGESLSEEATSQSHARVLRPDTMTHSDIPLPPPECVCERERSVGGAVTTGAEVKNPYKGRCVEQKKK